MSIEKRVKEIIVEQLGVNESEVNPELNSSTTWEQILSI